MAKRIALTTLNASTIDIFNAIRANAPYEYQQNIPRITTYNEIPAVGETLYGYPALANIFMNSLLTRIALVHIRSLIFNNPYNKFKKGYIEHGETIEEIFVDIAKVIQFNYEDVPEREFKRTVPDVRTAFHAINWRVIYPVSIDEDEFRRSFLTADGVIDLITKCVDSVYKGNEYDEFLLFKYMIIKRATSGRIKPIAVNTTNTTDAAKSFRAVSNLFTFPKTEYNEAGVLNNTPRDRQYLFMDARFNAEFDVDVLSAAFHMDKADFLGHVILIDDFTTFDNRRFAEIRAKSDGLEEVTAQELALMQDVKALLVDSDYFQIYDYTNRFTENYMGSGAYWNYWYHVRKAVDTSPFANAALFVDNSANIDAPAEIVYKVASKSVDNNNTVITLVPNDVDTLGDRNMIFSQSLALTQAGVAMYKYGAIIVPANVENFVIEGYLGANKYVSEAVATSIETGGTISMIKQ